MCPGRYPGSMPAGVEKYTTDKIIKPIPNITATIAKIF